MAGDGALKYGPQLSAAEYEQRLTRVHDRALAEAGPSPPPGELDRRVRALELDLAIDRRIGVDFPRDQREELLLVRERVEEKRKLLTMRLLKREISSRQFAEGMQASVASMVADLSSSLTPEEVKGLLDIPDLGAAVLPLDPHLVDPEAGER